MKWIVAAIVVFVVGYTLVNIYFRKPGRAARPYEDMANRFTTAKLLEAGWAKLPVETRRPAEKMVDRDSAAISRGAVGLGLDLEPCFAEKPKLLASIDRVEAPASTARGEAYSGWFTGSVSDLQLQLGNVELYHRGNELVLVPTIEHLPGNNLLSRWTDNNYCFSFPTQSLPPGRYQLRVVANGPSARWSVTIR
ncbi:MAG TPA: hypothetical protein VFJ90_05975 [Candidatus Didemnitutus sp.]|nr:hypothetical protein [Candidatus Didemnitutus sp.]